MADTFCCFASVHEKNVAIIESWGAFDRTAEAGLVCLNPISEVIAATISKRVQQLDVSCETKTADHVSITVVVSVQYEVLQGSEKEANYSLTDPHQQIRAYIFDVVRSTVPQIELDNVFLTKDQLANNVKEQLSRQLSSFGYAIRNCLVTDLNPDPRVKEKMNEINAAQRLRVAATDKAEAEKIMIVKSAEADAESKYLTGVGIARQRQAIVNGLRDSVVAFSSEIPNSKAQDVMDMMMLTQYFDMLKEVGTSGRQTTIFVPENPGAMATVAKEIHNGFLISES
ncbi:HIR complex subunit [Cymbomonas tetramitiformis]|uniref:HIR complex subunit n=1 Tax=Cymbomonas tetramitiformis TaxID=36881 RepID=A0AAE0L9P3_9CHLO|nr:HIR complex subunit [Cymbomonas tetramitiformis]